MNNRNMAESNEAVRKLELHDSCERIMSKLDEQYLAVSEVLRNLKITRRQLFHWDREGLRLGKSRVRDRSWRKFSIMNVFGFSLIKTLLKLGLRLGDCTCMIEWLQEKFYKSPYFLVHYAIGDVIFLFLDNEDKMVNSVIGLDKCYLMHNMERPNIVIPVHTLLTRVLDFHKREDLHAEFGRSRGQTNPDRVIFYVDGCPIEFNRLQLKYEAQEKEVVHEK